MVVVAVEHQNPAATVVLVVVPVERLTARPLFQAVVPLAAKALLVVLVHHPVGALRQVAVVAAQAPLVRTERTALLVTVGRV